MAPDQTLTVNATHCLKAIANFGSTTYQNVCNGTSVDVPWGTMDYAGVLFVGGLGAIVVLVVLAVMSDGF